MTSISMKPMLLLASGSPRRKALLESMGLDFTVLVTDIDESVTEGEVPEDYVVRLAEEKAHAAGSQVKTEHAILAADTIVCQNEIIFAKPKDKNDAYRIWQQLSNSNHRVITAVCLLAYGRVDIRVCVTDVSFCSISEEQMKRYWQSGEPQDKAGAYAIQGLASAWVQKIQGSYSNVVGLPLFEVNDLLRTIDLNWM